MSYINEIASAFCNPDCLISLKPSKRETNHRWTRSLSVCVCHWPPLLMKNTPLTPHYCCKRTQAVWKDGNHSDLSERC